MCKNFTRQKQDMRKEIPPGEDFLLCRCVLKWAPSHRPGAPEELGDASLEGPCGGVVQVFGYVGLGLQIWMDWGLPQGFRRLERRW